ncbi:ATP-binding protein [Streptomyces sp. NPDC053560]|uniref:ATP-binding protein n=1 Tax=Streptomyces sp. NPDC053560 TaxID=3365711 RepID=UPI0037D971A6
MELDRGRRESELRMEGPVDTDVPSATAEHLLAVLTEALSNIAPHAHARRVDVTLTVADETVLSVTDDGAGLGSGASGRGGLADIRSRAEQLGGTLHLRRRTRAVLARFGVFRCQGRSRRIRAG